jgi:hypothetical protein
MDEEEIQQTMNRLTRVLDAAGLRWIADQALHEIAIEELAEDAGKVTEPGIASERQPVTLVPRQRLLKLIAAVRAAVRESRAMEDAAVTSFTSHARAVGIEGELEFSRDSLEVAPQVVRLGTRSLTERGASSRELLNALELLDGLAQQ